MRGMAPDASDETSPSTRERLLDAAAALFAERGRDGVPIRDIAARAGVRHGCINYHFRSKDDLYQEALVRSCAPPANDLFERGVPDGMTADEARAAFRELVGAVVADSVRPLDPVAAGLMRGEIFRPEGPDDVLFERVIRPRQRMLAALIGRMFPRLTSERERRVAAFNVASQFLFLRIARPVALRLFEVDEFDDELTDLVASRIVETALRGLGSAVEGSES